MSKRALDIWAIQGLPEELDVAMERIRSHDTIVFENAIVELTIGDKKIRDTVFSCAIFSERSDTLVLVMKGAGVSAEDAKAMLDKKGIRYHLVSFLEPSKRVFKKRSPEIWFARDSYVVSDACDNTKSKGNCALTYEFDADQVSKLKFKFLDSVDNLQTFDGQIVFTGTITLEDKIILLEGATEKFIKEHQQEALRILAEKGFTEVKIDNHSV